MNKTRLRLCAGLLLSLPTLLSAQTGKVFENLSLKSEILDMERRYAAYLPPDYSTSERSYPVLYLLHGSGDDQTGWVQFGEILHIADKAIREGTGFHDLRHTVDQIKSVRWFIGFLMAI